MRIIFLYDNKNIKSTIHLLLKSNSLFLRYQFWVPPASALPLPTSTFKISTALLPSSLTLTPVSDSPCVRPSPPFSGFSFSVFTASHSRLGAPPPFSRFSCSQPRVRRSPPCLNFEVSGDPHLPSAFPLFARGGSDPSQGKAVLRRSSPYVPSLLRFNNLLFSVFFEFLRIWC